MAILTYMGATYDCATAIKGPDYIHLLDENGNMIAAFDGVKSFSDFTLTGCDYTVPQNTGACKIVVMHEDGTMGPGPYTCQDVGDAAKRAEDVSKSIYAIDKFYKVGDLIGPCSVPYNYYNASSMAVNGKYFAAFGADAEFYDRATGELVYKADVSNGVYPNLFATDDKLFVVSKSSSEGYPTLYNPETKVVASKMLKVGSRSVFTKYAGHRGDKAYLYTESTYGVVSAILDVNTLSVIEEHTTVLPYTYTDANNGSYTPSGIYAKDGYGYCIVAKTYNDKVGVCLRVYDFDAHTYKEIDMPTITNAYGYILWRDDDSHNVYFRLSSSALYSVNYVTGEYAMLNSDMRFEKYFGHVDDHTVCLRDMSYYFYLYDLSTNTVLKMSTSKADNSYLSSNLTWDCPKFYQPGKYIFPVNTFGCFRSYVIDKETLNIKQMEYVEPGVSLSAATDVKPVYMSLCATGEVLYAATSETSITSSTGYHVKHWVGTRDNGYGLSYNIGFVQEVPDVRS